MRAQLHIWKGITPTVKTQFFSTMICLCLLTGCSQPVKTPTPIPTRAVGEFAIYLVNQAATTQQMLQADLGEIELRETPILPTDDIIAYTWKTHEIELTDSAYARIGQLDVPVTTGVPFVVCVGRERIYGGAFWVSFSSATFHGIVIDALPATQNRPLRIQLGYPESPEFFKGEDLRSDPRIRQALETAGKLK
jgi:hypothetical protein